MLIECAKIKYYLFIPLIFPIFIQIRKFFITNKNHINDNAFFKLFRYYLSYILSGLCILVIKLRTKYDKRVILKKMRMDKKRDSDCNWVNPLDKEKKIIEKGKNYKNFFFFIDIVYFKFNSEDKLYYFKALL